MQRKYKDPDKLKASYSVSMTENQHKVLVKAAKLAGLLIGDFVFKASVEFITMYEVRGMEKGFKQ